MRRSPGYTRTATLLPSTTLFRYGVQRAGVGHAVECAARFVLGAAGHARHRARPGQCRRERGRRQFPHRADGGAEQRGIVVWRFVPGRVAVLAHARSLARCDEPYSAGLAVARIRSEEHTSELQSLMRISYAVFCLKKKKHTH